MSNWNGVSRSNYFHVNDISAFQEEMSAYEVKVQKRSDDGRFVILSESEDGSWPCHLRLSDRLQVVLDQVLDDMVDDNDSPTIDKTDRCAVDELVKATAKTMAVDLSNDDLSAISDLAESEDPDFVDFDFPFAVAHYLAEGEIAVFQTVGNEKLRYLSGYAVAYNCAQQEVRISLEDIYKLAKDKFGVEPNPAAY